MCVCVFLVLFLCFLLFLFYSFLLFVRLFSKEREKCDIGWVVMGGVGDGGIRMRKGKLFRIYYVEKNYRTKNHSYLALNPHQGTGQGTAGG